MIKLEVKEYCQECSTFEPVVTSRPEIVHSLNRNYISIGNTSVRCVNADKCERLKRYLESKKSQ